MGSARGYQKPPPCLIEPMPAGSQMVKAEPISDSGRASGIAYLRMEKSTVPDPLQPEKWEYVGPMLEQGKGERSSPHEENAVTETICDELSTTPILHASVSLGKRGREFRSEAEPRKKGAVG